MTAVDWPKVDEAVKDRVDPVEMSSAFARGVAVGSLRSRRRLWLLRLLAVGVVGAVALASFGVRAAVHGSAPEPDPNPDINGKVAPLVRSVTPRSGPPRGGTSVIIRGRGLTGTTAVYFGSRTALFETITDRRIRATSPQHRVGKVQIRLQSAASTSPRGQGAAFTFVRGGAPDPDPNGGGGGGNGGGGGGGGGSTVDNGPVVTGIAPVEGPTTGGQEVVVLGTGLADVQSVAFGEVDATITKAGSETQVVVETPAQTPGTVAVVVTTPSGRSSTSNAPQYIYRGAAPRLKTITPANGTTEGGTTVTLKGQGLGEATGVSFGGASVGATPNEDGTELTVTTPPHARGPVDVWVDSPNGQSNTAQYRYLRTPD